MPGSEMSVLVLSKLHSSFFMHFPNPLWSCLLEPITAFLYLDSSPINPLHWLLRNLLSVSTFPIDSFFRISYQCFSFSCPITRLAFAYRTCVVFPLLTLLFTIQSAYKALTPPAASLSWPKNIWFPANIPMHACTAWLAIQERLKTKDFLAKLGLGYDCDCALCNRESK